MDAGWIASSFPTWMPAAIRLRTVWHGRLAETKRPRPLSGISPMQVRIPLHRSIAALGLLTLSSFALACSGDDSPTEPTPDPVLDETSLTITPADGEVGVATEFVVSAEDSDGQPWTGGLALAGEVTGTNVGSAVTTATLGGGDYAIRYTPGALGFDTVTVFNDGVPLAGSPVASRVRIVFEAGTGSPSIDGTLSTGEWDTADAYDVFAGPLEGSTVRFIVDATNLYVAFRYPEPDPGSLGASVRFDNLVDLTINGDDYIRGSRAAFFDGFFGTPSIEMDAVVHGAASTTNEGGFMVVEMRHPLNSGDSEDISLAAGGRVGVCVRAFSSLTAAAAQTSFPAGCITVSQAQQSYAELILPE